MTDRAEMRRALASIAVPKVRALGFTGSMPHFQRKRGAEHQLLMLMFNKYGGSFYLEVGQISDAEFLELQAYWASSGKQLSEEALTVGHCPWRFRKRLGGNTDNWFVFGADRHGDTMGCTAFPSSTAIAEQVAAIVTNNVEAHFGGNAA